MVDDGDQFAIKRVFGVSDSAREDPRMLIADRLFATPFESVSPRKSWLLPGSKA